MLSYVGLWGLYPADCLIAHVQLQSGSRISVDICNLLNLNLEFLDRNVSVLQVYCNESVLLLLGLRVVKRVVVQSTKECLHFSTGK